MNKMLSKYERNIEYLMVKFRKACCGNSDNFSNVPNTCVTPKDDDVAGLVIRQFSGLN